MYNFIKLVLLISISVNCNGARILGIFPIPSYSHQVVYQPVWRALAEKGHDMVVLTTDPVELPTLPNLKQIDLSFTYELWNIKHNFTEIINESKTNPFTVLEKFMELLNDVMRQELEHPEVQAIIKNKTEHFDLLMVEYMQPTMYAFKHRFNCPMIGLTSMDVTWLGHDAVGNPSHAILYPESTFPLRNETFWDRLFQILLKILFNFYGVEYIMPKEDQTVADIFGKGYPPLYEVGKMVDMLFINTNPILHIVRPLTPATITIGGGIHIKLLKPLPKQVSLSVRMFLKLVFLLSISVNCNGARILGVFPIPSYSHQVVYQPVWRALAEKGHDMVVLTTDPVKLPTLPNLKQIDLSFTYETWNTKHNLTNIINESYNNPFVMVEKIMELLNDVMRQELAHPEVAALIKNESEHFDLLMVEYMQPTMFAFKQRFKCPMIGLTSLDAPWGAHNAVGNPTHSVLYPESTSPYENENFFGRLFTILYKMVMGFYGFFYILPKEDETVDNIFGKGYPPLYKIGDMVDMLFINVNPVFHNVRPLTPATIIIGGGIHIQTLKPLPKDIETFMNASKNGVIYFSLGSNVKSKDIPMETRQLIMEVFAKIPYDILWKFEEDNLPGKPKNVKIMKWIPQQDVLRHPKVKLFITQGGLQSSEEGLFSHVPFVVLPFFADQDVNARRIQSNGLGITLDYKTMTSTDFHDAIMEVINNEKYRKRVKELSDLVKDQPMTGLEKAVWWTEYVLRHKDLSHLKGPAVKIPTYQFFYLDIIAFVFGVIIVLALITYFIIKMVIKSICKLFGKKKTKKE